MERPLFLSASTGQSSAPPTHNDDISGAEGHEQARSASRINVLVERDLARELNCLVARSSRT